MRKCLLGQSLSSKFATNVRLGCSDYSKTSKTLSLCYKKAQEKLLFTCTFWSFFQQICSHFTNCNKAYVTFVLDLEKQTPTKNAISNFFSGIFVLLERLMFLLFLFLFSCSVICYQKMQEMNL